MRLTSGQKVTSSWAMGLAAILAKNDGIEFNTQHGGPSFGWWMRFKTRHPELGLLNSPNKEVSQSSLTVPGQSTVFQWPVIQSTSNVTIANDKKDILHVAAADAIGTEQTIQGQDDLQKQLPIESEVQNNLGKDMDIDRQMHMERPLHTPGRADLEAPMDVEREANVERPPNISYLGGQIYY